MVAGVDVAIALVQDPELEEDGDDQLDDRLDGVADDEALGSPELITHLFDVPTVLQVHGLEVVDGQVVLDEQGVELGHLVASIRGSERNGSFSALDEVLFLYGVDHFLFSLL